MNAVKVTTVCIQILNEIMVKPIKINMCLRPGYGISAVLFHIYISKVWQLCTTKTLNNQISGEPENTHLTNAIACPHTLLINTDISHRILFFFLILVCGAIGTSATPGLLCQPRVIVKMIVEKQMDCRLAGETKVLGENLPQRHFCPSQNPT
jgi:hypothetical protein